MLSVNKDDCLVCAMAEAKGISYKTAFYSVRTMGKVLNPSDKENLGMPRISNLRAIFSKSPMVLVYETGGGNGHAVAVINGRCVDNAVGTEITNMTVLWALIHREVVGVFKARR